MSGTACPHCATPVAPGARTAPYCCAGCREVAALLAGEGLGRFYELGGGRGVPVAEPPPERSLSWLEPLLAKQEGGSAPVCRLELDVQGVHCAACVWLMDELFRRRPGGAGFTVNPALGKVRLAWERGRFDVPAFLQDIERFGYRFGPARKKAGGAADDLALRLGACAAIAMNVGIFHAAFYLGLAPREGQLYRFFGAASLALSAAVVAVGGWPFFRAAARGLRRGVLHLDLPIAVGILSTFAMSVWRWHEGGGALAYFDTLDVFVTLMLAGRWLQQRVIDRNRSFLLDDGGLEGLHVRRREGDRLAVAPATDVRAGDELLLAPGDLLPVDAEVTGARGLVSLDWITGEPEPRAVRAGDALEAGSFNAAREALAVRAAGTLEQSRLPSLLRAGAPGEAPAAGSVLPPRLLRWYVPAVAALALGGFLLWLPRGVPAAADVAVALLVVTCPCALGLAVPLAAELALAHLRRRGVFVRSGDLLRRALRVRTVAFDKTGTLTLGRPELEDPAAVERLDYEALAALYALASRSNHPASRCLAAHAARRGARFEPEAQVVEHPGLGLETARGGAAWRLGAPAWALGRSDARAGTVLARDGVEVGRFHLREAMRADAAETVQALQGAGLDVWLLSGDAPARVQAAAAALGLGPERARAALAPEQKASFVRALGADATLFVGDGVNDAPAFAQALATGTPAVDRPVMPARADFFLLGESVTGVRELLATARRLHATVAWVLATALVYNAVAIGASLAGWVTPLRAAIAMPASSLLSIGLAVWGLSARRRARAAAKEAGALREAVQWT